MAAGGDPGLLLDLVQCGGSGAAAEGLGSESQWIPVSSPVQSCAGTPRFRDAEHSIFCVSRLSCWICPVAESSWGALSSHPALPQCFAAQRETFAGVAGKWHYPFCFFLQLPCTAVPLA